MIMEDGCEMVMKMVMEMDIWKYLWKMAMKMVMEKIAFSKIKKFISKPYLLTWIKYQHCNILVRKCIQTKNYKLTLL